MNDDTIGIDISKDHLDAHRLSDAVRKRFSNDAPGHAALLRWSAGTPPMRVVYEPTGRFHLAFEAACSGRLPLVKVNPLQARRFAQAQGTRAKTDPIDARALARMGAALQLVPDRPISETEREIRELQVVRSGLTRDRTALINRLAGQTLALTRRLTRARLRQAEHQIVALDAEIDARLTQCARRARALQIMMSIPGIGRITARRLLVECPELGTLASKPLAALAGLAPMVRQSGKWHGKAHIQGGRRGLREALFMPALVAMKRHPALAAKYTAMREAGKAHKVALTTLMRKLLILANTLIKEDRLWAPKPA